MATKKAKKTPTKKLSVKKQPVKASPKAAAVDRVRERTRRRVVGRGRAAATAKPDSES